MPSTKPEDEENEFTTIRIWREDKAKLEAMRIHDRQGIHEIIRGLILTTQINDKVIIPLSNDDFLAISKSDPNYEQTVKKFRERTRKIMEEYK